LRTATSLPEPVELGYRRLMFDLGLLKDSQDFEDLALSAVDAGAPAEAIRMLEWGFENGIFSGPDEARFKRLLVHAKEQAARNKARLAELVQAAQRATTGRPSVALGRAYLGSGQYDDAATMLQRGLQKGQLSDPDEARVELGIAYLKDDQPERARETFAAVAAGSQWHDLADLWSLRASNQASSRE
ncbi:MAG: tetratricopeptide repeat protein, partial [Steroidobacteraceae bacterium]